MEIEIEKIARKQVEETLESIKIILGNRILGVYLYGSIVLDGLKPDSDLDIFVIIQGEVSLKDSENLTKDFLSISGEIGNEELKRYIEVSIVSMGDISAKSYPVKWQYMYGEWLREELEEGLILEPFFDYDLTILIHQIRNTSVSLVGPDAGEIIEKIDDLDIKKAIKESLPNLINNIKGDERNTVLTLCRMYYTSEKGEIISKDRAAEYILPEIPAGLEYLVEKARLGYLGLENDMWDEDGENLEKLLEFLCGCILERVM